VFTRGDGQPINPNYATTRFRKLVQRAGLPPVRLHDLRHSAASLAHQAGADLKALQDLLGHSSIVTTADTYTSVLPEVQRASADATAHRCPDPDHPSQSREHAGQDAKERGELATGGGTHIAPT
jgi:site-specific recombinase XerD